MNKFLLGCLFVGIVAGAAIAQTTSTHSTRTVGLISEPVARRLLQQRGYSVQSLSLQGSKYLAVATKNGKSVSVSMDAASGLVTERKAP